MNPISLFHNLWYVTFDLIINGAYNRHLVGITPMQFWITNSKPTAISLSNWNNFQRPKLSFTTTLLLKNGPWKFPEFDKEIPVCALQKMHISGFSTGAHFLHSTLRIWNLKYEVFPGQRCHVVSMTQIWLKTKAACQARCDQMLTIFNEQQQTATVEKRLLCVLSLYKQLTQTRTACHGLFHFIFVQ